MSAIFSGAVKMPMSGELLPPYDTNRRNSMKNPNSHVFHKALCSPLLYCMFWQLYLMTTSKEKQHELMG